MVRRYMVLESRSLEKLSVLVTRALEQDWQPCGGVAVLVAQSNAEDEYRSQLITRWFIQAVVK